MKCIFSAKLYLICLFVVSTEQFFMTDPQEYIHNDLIHFDIDARRCAVRKLIRLLITNKNFGSIAIAILINIMKTLLAKYLENPVRDWRAKEKALFLARCLTSYGCTQFATEKFFNEQIYPVLDQPNVSSVLKVAAIKLVLTCSAMLKQKLISICINKLKQNLDSKNVVVRHYSEHVVDILHGLASPRTRLIEYLASVANETSMNTINSSSNSVPVMKQQTVRAIFTRLQTLLAVPALLHRMWILKTCNGCKNYVRIRPDLYFCK